MPDLIAIFLNLGHFKMDGLQFPELPQPASMDFNTPKVLDSMHGLQDPEFPGTNASLSMCISIVAYLFSCNPFFCDL